MAAFLRISPVDLISGLVQYSTTLRALQTHPNVDATLPLAGGRLSDLFDLGADVGALADSLIEIVPFDDDADPTDDHASQVVVVKIQTIGDLADKLDGLPGFSGGTLQPTYDSTTQRVTLDVAFSQALDGLSALDLPDGSEVAQLDLRRPAPVGHRPARRLTAGQHADRPAGRRRLPRRPADPHRPVRRRRPTTDNPDTLRRRVRVADGLRALRDRPAGRPRGGPDPHRRLRRRGRAARSASSPPPSAAPTSSSRTGRTRPPSWTSTPPPGRPTRRAWST